MTALRVATRSRRATEAGLLFLAGLVIGSAYALASLGRAKVLPADIWPFLGVVLVLFVMAHLGVRRLAPNADPLLMPLAVFLNGLGYVLIARLDSDLAAQQSTWTGLGILGFIVTLMVVRRIGVLESRRYTIGLIGILLVVLPLVPGVGRTINGSRIWVRLGPVSFQPGEFAKVALAIFFAGYLVERRELVGAAIRRLGPIRVPELRHAAPILVAWGFSLVVMIFSRDLGSALLFFVLFLSMLWVATERLTYLVGGLLLFAAGAYGSWRSFTHVQQRVTAWIDPWSDAQGSGYQIIQSTYAFAWGGATGTGLGLGISGRIPYQETDFIFAIIGEELGLFGAAAVLMAFLIICGSGYRVAIRSTDPFSTLLACGLTTLIGFQAFLIMGGVTRLLPLTGVTLPFVSYGGSSLLANWVLVALLVRMSDDVESARIAGGSTAPR